jgi:glycosyltransferase involved in cell wall biosynthesis
MKTFSIIIPVYNVEAYLEQCLDSVINQTYGDFEAILIDDGSKDNSGRICDEYCAKDSRLKVIHKHNGGVSSARNDGIAAASGEYLIFLDSDDYLVLSALQMLHQAISTDNCEMYMFGYQSFIDGQASFDHVVLDKLSHLTYKNGAEFADKAVGLCNWLPASAWCISVKRAFIAKSGIHFDTELIYGEDADFSLRCLLASDTVRYLPKIIICFRAQRAGSATTTMSYKHIASSFNYCTDKYYYFLNQNNSLMANYFACKSANTVYRICGIRKKEEVKELIKLFEAEKEMLFSASGSKYRVAIILWSLFGYKKGSDILYIINWIRGK